MDASVGCAAAVNGTIVSIIAGVFVDLSITIVVQAITDFGHGFRCITCSQAFG